MLTQVSPRTKGVGAFLILALISSLQAIIARYLSFSLPLFEQIYLRTTIAFLLGFFFFGKNLNWRKLKKISLTEWLLIFLRSAIMFVFGAVLWVKATTLTKLGNLAFIDALPITATLILLFRVEKITFPKVFFIVLSFVGIVMLSVKDYGNLLSFGYGELLVFISGFFFAVRNISRRWHSTLLNDAEITQLMFFFGTLLLIFSSFLFGERPVFSFSAPLILLAVLVGGLFNVGNLFFNNYGFARVSAVLGSTLVNLEIVFSMVLGFFFYQEILTLKEFTGGILIVAAVIGMHQLDHENSC